MRRRIVTALFCDVVGSTARAEDADAESVLDLMLRYYAEARAAIERHGGTVEKFIGDAVVGMFGVEVAHDDDALRAVRAAVETRERVAALAPELERVHGASVELRIGVNTGEAAAGVDPVSGAPLVVADAVNVAARLQQAAAPGDIVLGELTHRLVRSDVLTEALPPVAAKGKSRPVAIYRLRRVLGDRTRVVSDAGRPLVGREAEVGTLLAAFSEAVATRRARLVTVIGDAGIGKSRLAGELAARLDGDALVVHGAAPSYGDGVTYHALAQVVREAAAAGEDDGREETLRKLAARAGGGTDGRRLAVTIGEALGLCDGAGTSDEISAAVRELLEIVASARPLVAILDDLHWAEPAFLDLLERVASTAVAPLLLVCLARPDLLEGRPEWPVTIALEPLGEDDAARLLRDLVGPGFEAVGRRVAAVAQGNALFLEQLIAMLADDGVLTRDAGAPASALDPRRITLPPSLTGLLTARLDRLPPTARVVAERAAVEGVRFHADAVGVLCADAVSATDVEEALGDLVARRFVEPADAVPPWGPAYRFRHVLLREAAYAGASKALRARLHEACAAWVGTRGEGSGEHEEIVGHHLEQAFRLRAALGPLDDATRAIGARAGAFVAAGGRRALARGDVALAARLLLRALELLPAESALRPEVTYEVGAALVELGELARAEPLLAATATASGAGGDQRLRARADLELSWLRVMLGSMTLAAQRETADRVIRLGEEAGDDMLLGRAYYIVGAALFAAELHAQAVTAYEQSLVHARRADDRRLEADALYFCGCAVFFGPSPVVEAAPRWEALLDAARRRPAVEAAAATGLALLRALQGRFAEARDLLAWTFETYDELGMTVHRAGNAYCLAEVELLAGDWPAAEAAARSGYERFLALGERTFASGGATYLATIADADARYDDVGAHLAAAADLAEPGDIQSWGRIGALRGMRLARAGRYEEALAAVDEAEAVVIETETPGVLADILRSRATVLRSAGRPTEADRAVRRALRLYEGKGNEPYAQRCRALLEPRSPEQLAG